MHPAYIFYFSLAWGGMLSSVGIGHVKCSGLRSLTLEAFVLLEVLVPSTELMTLGS